MIISFLFSLYLFCTYSFVFNICILLRVFLIVFSSMILSLVVYFSMGFSWYLLLFILVYVGGVYVLFVYISLTLPNFGLVKYYFGSMGGWLNLAIFFVFGLSILYCGGGANVIEDYSFYLCHGYEYLIYLFFCFILLLGITLINFITSSIVVYIR